MEWKTSKSKVRSIAGVFLAALTVGAALHAATSPAQKGGAAAAGARKTLGSLTVPVPSGWVEQPAGGPMRKMQFKLPRVAGDSEDGELIVFNFGPGQGGSVEANIDRWAKQFSQPDGSDSRKKAKIEKRQVAGMATTLFDVKGTYEASSMMSMPPQRSGKPGFRMLGAIVEAREGSYYFKLTGPEKTINQWADNFQQFINGIQKK